MSLDPSQPDALSPAEEYYDLVRSVRAHLQWLRAGGALGLPRSAEEVLARTAGSSAASAGRPRASAAPPPPAASAAPPPEAMRLFAAAREDQLPAAAGSAPAARAKGGLVVYPELPDPLPLRGEAGLDRIRDVIGNCTRCKLCHGRNQIVFGQGGATPPVVFVGEGPGAEEDRTGLPFVGAAGDLLTRMIAAMGLSRQEVFICNVVKCRPPGNRTPEPDEIATCGPFLRAQIQALAPRVLVALGRTPAQFLLGNGAPISRIRGRWASWEGIPLMPTFHPAYLLRTPSAKREVWEDLKLVMAKLKEP